MRTVESESWTNDSLNDSLKWIIQKDSQTALNLQSELVKSLQCEQCSLNHEQMTLWMIPWNESFKKTHKQTQTHNLNQSNDYSVSSGVWIMNKWLSNWFTVMNQSKRLTNRLKLTIWIGQITTVWTVQSESWTNDSLNDSLKWISQKDSQTDSNSQFESV